MATMKNDLWGGFSGKIGNVVGVSRNGAFYLRSLPVQVKKSESKKQIAQRNRFSVTHAFLQTCISFIRIGFQSEARAMRSAFNAAMSYNILHAVKVEAPDFEIDYPNVLVSKGPLPTSSILQASISEGALHVQWDATCEGKATEHDQVMILACNPEKKSAVYDLYTGKRGSLTSQLQLPSQWQGDTVEAYIAFMSANDFTLVSDSQYAGRHRVEV